MGRTANHIAGRLASYQVNQTLAAMMLRHGFQDYLRLEDGPEFIAKELRERQADMDRRTLYLEAAGRKRKPEFSY